MGGEFRRSHDLHFQPDAEISERALRDRLRDAEGGTVAADQYRRLRYRQAQDRPEGEGGVQADRRRATAVLHAGVERFTGWVERSGTHKRQNRWGSLRSTLRNQENGRQAKYADQV